MQASTLFFYESSEYAYCISLFVYVSSIRLSSIKAKGYFQTYFLSKEYSKKAASGILLYQLFSAHIIL